MKHLYKTILLVAAMGFSFCCFAQAPGSVSLYGGNLGEKNIAAGTSTDVSETLYIGPGTHTINGVWAIYAKNIIISSAAIVSGTGTIEIYNPSAAGATGSATLTDGNYSSNTISVNVQLNNASGMQLANMNFNTELTNAGWTQNTSASSLALNKQLALATDGANIVLGTGTQGDLVFTSNGTVSNYGTNRKVITNNSIVSHVVKQNYTSAFVFPVGIDADDYSPATIINASAIDVNVSVQNYTASASDESVFTNYGMQRTWHIYGSAAGTGSDITLQHNPLLNETKFNESSHFVTQYSDASANNSGDNYSTIPWQENTPGESVSGSARSAAALPGSPSAKNRTYASLPTSSSHSNFAYFSKRTSSNQSALPIKIISFNAAAQGCGATVTLKAEMDSDIKLLELQRGLNPYDFTTVHQWATAGGNGTREFTYSDKTVTGGQTYYYKVKISYSTGIVEYSDIAFAKPDCNNSQRVMLFPNPTNDFIYVQGLSPNTLKTIQVIDMSGKTWQQVSTSESSKRLNTERLPAGIYTIRILGRDGTVYFLNKFSKM
ncbi:MAG: T9SS type A sorting domain-containing protein [Agriterribacter sp.]